METLMTRDQYMAAYSGKTEQERLKLHQDYYAQLVSRSTVLRVVSAIGRERLLKSTNKWLNDIPLHEWDRVGITLPLARPFKALGDYATKAGLVCVAKEAARQFIAGEQEV